LCSLLLDIFMLGAWSFMMAYEAFHFHHFDWLNVMVLVTLVLPVFRYSQVVYRKLS